MKKSCKGCYAAETGKHPISGVAHGCSLGYKNDGQGQPLEDCPKPKSWKQLNRLKKNIGGKEQC